MIDAWKMELMKFNKDNEYCEELNLIYNLRERVLNKCKRNNKHKVYKLKKDISKINHLF